MCDRRRSRCPKTKRPGFHHLSLTVTDLDVSAAWYQEVFGLQPVTEETHDGGQALVFMQPQTGVFLGLHSHDHNDGRPFGETRTGGPGPLFEFIGNRYEPAPEDHYADNTAGRQN